MTSETPGRPDPRPAPERPRLYGPADHRAEPFPRGWLRRIRARGYQPTTSWLTPVRYILPDGTATDQPEQVGPAFGPPDRARIGIVAPTLLARRDPAEHTVWVSGLVDQVRDAARACPQAHLVLFIGMQWLCPDDAPVAVHRLARLTATVPADGGISLVGLALRGPGKARTLNAAIRLCERGGFTGMGWCDDDVRMELGCLRAMVGDFLADGCRGAVGATKIPHARPHATSRLLFRAKGIAAPATNYPHGCCMLVSLDTVAGGIPDRYISDDGYVCFRLLDPELDDPLRYLRLVPAASCHYHVAGPAAESRRRIRRLLLNHHVYLADWPIPSARYYLRHILFPGMWPLTRWDGSRGIRTGVLNAVIKWLYFCWFAAVGAELLLRGLSGRPLRRLVWATYTAPAVPSLSAGMRPTAVTIEEADP